MLGAKDDTGPYRPLAFPATAVDTCDRCKGLRVFCSDPGVYWCRYCRYQWQVRRTGPDINPKALHHYQGTPYIDPE